MLYYVSACTSECTACTGAKVSECSACSTGYYLATSTCTGNENVYTFFRCWLCSKSINNIQMGTHSIYRPKPFSFTYINVVTDINGNECYFSKINCVYI